MTSFAILNDLTPTLTPTLYDPTLCINCVMRLDCHFQSSATISAAAHLPENVLRVITELAADSSVLEIWLFGSQANRTASGTSDWDLLVFSDREPNVREERCQNVDVIWRGPTQTQREGCTIQIDFSNFQWSEKDDGTADYVGRKIIEFEGPGDTSISRVLRPPQKAICIWSARKSDDVPDNSA